MLGSGNTGLTGGTGAWLEEHGHGRRTFCVLGELRHFYPMRSASQPGRARNATLVDRRNGLRNCGTRYASSVGCSRGSTPVISTVTGRRTALGLQDEEDRPRRRVFSPLRPVSSYDVKAGMPRC
jgi:hypothetical protein